MRDVYEALGRVAATVHASGDRLLGGIHPEDGGSRRGYYVGRKGLRFELTANPTEPRFRVRYPLRMSRYLERYFEAGEPDDPGTTAYVVEEGELEAALEESLERVRDRREDLIEAIDAAVAPMESRTDTLHTGDDRWDGLALSAYLYPFEEEYGVRTYDAAMDGLAGEAERVVDTLHEELDVLPKRQDPAEPHPVDTGDREPGSIGFE